jgi:4'-phosphopantetheinyl transferase
MTPTLILPSDNNAINGTFVWIKRPPSEETIPNRLSDDEAILSPDEVERAERFRFRADYIAYVTAHALLRRCLSEHGGSAPEKWRFETEKHGRPVIVPEMNAPRLRFSLSHSRGLTACAVTDEADCGVDVEKIGRIPDPLEFAKSVFNAAEIESLERTERRLRDELFTAVWCLKEAYLKARGLGLSVPLDSFGFALKAPRWKDILFYPPDDDENRWRFRLHRPGPSHFAAIAVRTTSSTDEPL